MANLSIRNLTKRFGATAAVDDVSLDVQGSELVALLGPSGCGKTTLLRMVAGFIPATNGLILIQGNDITHSPPHKRDTGMVFQSYALFPHMTVQENVAFGLEMRRVPKDEIRQRVADAFRLVRLDTFGERYPRQLSGGQQQRVAIARALVIRPDVFLLDEPLSNLDAKLRQSVGLEIRALQQTLGLTTLFVTHDQNEALALADRLVLMNAGRVEQVGSASELYTKPTSVFVANFLGQANLIHGQVVAPSQFMSDDGLAMRCDTEGFAVGARAVLCVRPEHIEVGNAESGLDSTFDCRVEHATYLGASTELTVQVAGRSTTFIIQQQNRDRSGRPLANGDACEVGWRASAAILLREE
jgi:putative spermidine/putrescine transport system ATP-binding protein